MSARPVIRKKIARLEKSLRRTPPARIDLVEYLTVRKYASSKGKAKEMLRDGKVLSGDTVIGRTQGIRREEPSRIAVLAGKTVEDSLSWVEAPLVPASIRDSIRVIA